MPNRTKRTIKAVKEDYEISLNDAFEEFIDDKENHGISKATIHNYKQSFQYFTSYHKITENTSAKDITKDMVYKWTTSLRNKDISVASVNHYLRDIRTFLYYCMEEPRAYMPQFKIQLIDGQEELPKLYDEDELEALLVKPHYKNDFVEWRTYAVVNWICATGNRASTVLNVKIDDVNFSKNEISVRYTKNNKPQILPLSSSLSTCLKEYIKSFNLETGSDRWLFPNVGGEQLTYNALRLSFERYCKERGVERSSLHSLRHNFAKNYIQQNGNVFKLQQILGHSSVTMTKHYVALFGEDLKADYEDYSLLDVMKKSSKRQKKITSK